MRSIKELYKIGKGPSSSHTIGPERICKYALENFGDGKYKVELFGSLALTGKGHGTDRVIKEVLGDGTDIIFNTSEQNLKHPNSMKVYLGEKLVADAQSIGGGDVVINDKPFTQAKEVYAEKNFYEIRSYLEKTGTSLVEYVHNAEPDIDEYLNGIWQVMKACVERGIATEGTLNGGLHLARKAKILYNEEAKLETSVMHENRKLCAYALAVAEENADNGTIVTAPTCGSAGILPAVLYYMYKDYNVPTKDIINALCIAGVIGNVVKHNASISGAECGCQAEVGTACSMAAAALCSIYDCDIETTECAAEIALEHNLGLTCDPVLGLVQIPCIERNAMAAIKALSAFTLAKSLESKHKISFDDIVKVMYETGKDMNSRYRETSGGGLAKLYTNFSK